MGDNSPFGTQFGWYATLFARPVARNWRTADLDPRLQNVPPVIVTFTIQRDGSVVPGREGRPAQRHAAVDFSAQRAVLDASHFPLFQPHFRADQADMEMTVSNWGNK